MSKPFAYALGLALTLFSLQTLPASAQDTDRVQTESTIELGDTERTDAEIHNRINNLLREINGFEAVDVQVSQGVVTITGRVLDSARQGELTAIVNRVAGVVAIENRTEISGSLEERLTPAVERLTTRTRNVIANGPILLVALLAFAVVAAGGWLLTTRIGLWTRLAPNAFIADVYRALARIIFIILGIVLALDILNATALIGAVLGAAGVVGLAVGFAVRDTVENFIASILLSLRQPFRPNDVIEVDGSVGTVARLTSRATILISPEGNHIRIPNSTVFKGKIVNYTRDPNRRFEFTLGVDADADLASALATAVDALQHLPFVLDEPAVGAWISEVGDSNVLMTFAGWVDQTETDFLKARGEAIRTVKLALEHAGFGLPEPIYRVRLDGNLGLAGESSAPNEDIATAPEGGATELPRASDPTHIEEATSLAAERERAAADAEDDLLNDQQMAE